jgi:predicted dehydrogenase
MSSTIRWGVLSTANIGRVRVIPAIRGSRNGEVRAIASRSLQSAQDFASSNGIPYAYGSYDELLADPDIDAIYNPLPNSLHAEWAIKCAEAGKPMLCEKPLALDAGEAQRMVDAFAERDLPFAEAFMYRFHPQIMRVKEMVATDEIGDVHSIQATFTFSVRDADDIRLDADLGGGSLMDVGCYCVSVMRFITGEEPESVLGIAHTGEHDVDVNFSGVLRFPSGVLGHFDSGLRSNRTNWFTVIGSEGRIRVNESFVPAINQPTSVDVWRGDKHEMMQMEGADPYRLMAEDFAGAVLNEHPPRFAPSDAVAGMRVLDSLKAAAGL